MLTNWLIGGIKVNPKDFYLYNSSQRKTIKISLLSKGEMVVVRLFETEQAFNDQFTDVLSKTLGIEVPLLQKLAPSMSDIHVLKWRCHKVMITLNPSKALGMMNSILESLKNLRYILVLFMLICSNNLLIRVKSQGMVFD